MFDGSRKGRPGQSSEDLEALVAASREERAALSTMLAQMQAQAARLAASGRAIQEIEGRAAKACAEIGAAAGRLDEAGARASDANAFAERLALMEQVVVELRTDVDQVLVAIERLKDESRREPPAVRPAGVPFDLDPAAVRETVDDLARRLSALTAARQPKSWS